MIHYVYKIQINMDNNCFGDWHFIKNDEKLELKDRKDELIIEGNDNIKNMVIENCDNLSIVQCTYENLQSIEMINCKDVIIINCKFPSLKTVKLDNNIKCKFFYCNLPELKTVYGNDECFDNCIFGGYQKNKKIKDLFIKDDYLEENVETQVETKVEVPVEDTKDQPKEEPKEQVKIDIEDSDDKKKKFLPLRKRLLLFLRRLASCPCIKF